MTDSAPVTHELQDHERSTVTAAPEQPWREFPGGVKGRVRQCTTLADLPPGMYHANRYDTDDRHVLHLWDDEGRGFDIRRRKDV